MTDWQPIETAPKDGRFVLCYGHGGPVAMEPMKFYAGDAPGAGEWGWLEGDTPRRQPTHWMPLPEPPK